ncbi:alpha-amylase family glycosyl hydrolase [Patulibacter sp. NPDC049589]|uniref:alpha-amylase family glycosyl hydrolase n=1 Tax=Patulibacter sp. NPDC049589 TaxID=3154731 RepID=UPI0034290F02
MSTVRTPPPAPARTTQPDPGWAPTPLHPGWWRDGVLYQVYPRSFLDTDGDGHGDLPGVAARLPYLQRLGVSGIWMTPITDSPNADWGYDVSDYLAVHPDFGTAGDARELFDAAHERGLGVIHDIVPNHTSDRHPWFVDACTGRDARFRGFFVWADPRPDGSPPNNWVSMFGGPAWAWHEPTGQYYLHNFTPQQPDLNWWDPRVRRAFRTILRHWTGLGVDGFRVDVCQAIVKDRELRDNPPATAEDRTNVRLRGQRPVYSMNRPEVHDVLREWRGLLDRHPRRPILLGETNTHDLAALSRYYGDTGAGGGSELHMAFNFRFMSQPYEAGPLREIIAETERVLPAHAQPVWTLSNHDGSRYVTRWLEGDQDRVRGALMLLLCLRGTAMLYYGDELGLEDAPPIPVEDARDPLAHGGLPGKESRDPHRAPMPWDGSAHAGFSSATPWLPAHDPARTSVEAQERDPDSHLRTTTDLIALRGAHPDLHRAPMELPELADGVLTLRRGPLDCHVNLSGRDVELPGGRVLLATRRRDDGTAPERLRLAPWQGAVVARG